MNATQRAAKRMARNLRQDHVKFCADLSASARRMMRHWSLKWKAVRSNPDRREEATLYLRCALECRALAREFSHSNEPVFTLN